MMDTVEQVKPRITASFSRISRRARTEGPAALVVLCVMALAAAVRLPFVLGSDFPLNDGGLFYQMTEELRQAHYVLPSYTAYNAAHIPFAYPPLGFYLAGLLADLGHWSLLTLFRFLPLVINLLSVPAFYALSRDLLPSPVQATVATLAFALLPRSSMWLIMGGGIARAPGMLFMILALQQAYRLYTHRQRRFALTTALLCACTVLSHLETAWVLAVSMVLFFLAYGRRLRGLIDSALVAALTLALTAPWWLTVISRHGLGVFVAASNDGWAFYSGLLDLFLLRPTPESPIPIVLELVAMLGLLVCCARRRFLLPAWVLTVFALDPRAAATTATPAVALLSAIGMIDGLWPILDGGLHTSYAEKPAGRSKRWLPQVVFAALLLSAVFSIMLVSSTTLPGVPLEERQAMAWVAANTPEGSRFVVIPDTVWEQDAVCEWFPVLTGRVSVNTVQGHEWLSDFSTCITRYEALRKCAQGDVDCLDTWAARWDVSFAYVYISKQGASKRDAANNAVLCDLSHDPHYDLIYNGSAAAIFRRKG